MKTIDQKIINFIEKHRIGVLTTLLPDGRPHSASMHVASRNEPLTFIFFTKKDSRKCSHLETNKKYPASLVIGFSEEEFIELQLEGDIEKIDKNNSIEAEKVFASKFAGAKLDDEHIVLSFSPNWWRYTEFRPKPYTIISSEDN
jgi:general stress protein 26